MEDKKLQEDSIGYTKALLALKEEIDDLVNFSFSDHIKF